MSRRQLASVALVAVVALATGFVVAGQIKAQLLTPSNQLARYRALALSVQELEATNADDRRQISAMRGEIDSLEASAAAQSSATQQLRDQVAELRAHAGLVAMHGPGVVVDLRNGVPGPDVSGQAGYLVNFQDVQDVVNLLFSQGAEGISVNGRRITPLSAFSGSAGEVVIDQGLPLTSPLQVSAIGDRNRMLAAFGDPAALPGIRGREIEYGLQLSIAGSPDVTLPPYDSSLEAPHVSPA